MDPWTVLNIDLMGPFGATNKKHMYVLLLTDVFTKWTVILPLCDLSAAEVAKAVLHASFCYGLPQKIAIAQGEEFINQINSELFEFLGMKELIMPHLQTDHEHAVSKRIRSFLLKHCMENTKDWDNHLEAIAYAFNLIHSKKDQNTPYFQIFQRNPYMPSGVVQEGKSDCLFARIISVVKHAERAGQESTVSTCQALKKMPVNLQNRNMGHVRKKPKQLNPYLLKVGHEVLRQRKNWWKGGSFRSQWVGPCIIDYITDNGSAILRDAAGSRLKRPIKIAHLKPFIRGSQEQDSSHTWQSALVVDHDYIGSTETAMEQSSADMLSANGQPPAAPEDAVLESDLVLSKNNSDLEYMCRFH
ncbi:hypothetical protein JRQ81_013674 [Phrynocephalus forsythii]|uniref:Integrase catalytic domain-containing protein n=1 Tax=Phrynocephalus forsythii TaxID=171643 RepID=A0A9Q1B495_9SAUR|nr:hypothetical protein JRQ81_013674 [Phrynocephalus forsythii]